MNPVIAIKIAKGVGSLLASIAAEKAIEKIAGKLFKSRYQS